MSKPKVCRGSIAIACDGSVIANVHNYAGEKAPAALLRRAIALGGEIFIGVRLRGREARDTLARLDDAGHEGAGTAFVDRERRRRKKARKNPTKKKSR